SRALQKEITSTPLQGNISETNKILQNVPLTVLQHIPELPKDLQRQKISAASKSSGKSLSVAAKNKNSYNEVEDIDDEYNPNYGTNRINSRARKTPTKPKIVKTAKKVDSENTNTTKTISAKMPYSVNNETSVLRPALFPCNAIEETTSKITASTITQKDAAEKTYSVK
ncbi:hypothetical protein HK096_002049, partial [Nowakowskiella sp. JEL0078]